MSLGKRFLKKEPVCKVTFKLPEDSVGSDDHEVKVVGEFNDWNWEEGVTMKKKKGFYEAEVKLKRDREYQFRYLINNTVWANDWCADSYTPTPFGVDNSVVNTFQNEE